MGITLNIAETEAPQLAEALLGAPKLKELILRPATPAALILCLDAVQEALSRGALQQLAMFKPNLNHNYSPDAWSKLMRLFPKMTAVKTLSVDFYGDDEYHSCDDEAQELAEFLESGGMAKLKKVEWYNGEDKADGMERLRQVTTARGIELDEQ